MPRYLSATRNHFYFLTLLKTTFAAATFLSTLVAGISTHKLLLLTCKGEKQILMPTRFAAGALLGTAMLDLLPESNQLFHVLRHRYPLAFLLLCAGFLAAMLADCLLDRAVQKLGRECFMKSRPMFLDKIMLRFVSDFQPTKCCDTTLPIGVSKSEIKDCDGIGYLRYLVLNRATMYGDIFIALFVLFGCSVDVGAKIGGANTETKAWSAFLSAILHNIVYTISSISMLLRYLIPSDSSTKCLFFILSFPFMSPVGIIFMLLFNNGFNMSEAFVWVYAIFTGFCSGVLVYLSTHHLLIDGPSFKKFVGVICGFGLMAAVKILDGY